MSPVDWSSLPSELVEVISRKLTIFADYIRFRSVCKTWRSSTLPKPNHLPSQFPWLMLPQSGNNTYRRAFFDLANNQIHHLDLDLPELYSKNCRLRLCGSSHGWLAIVDYFCCPLLFNPLSREKFTLPRLSYSKEIALPSFVAQAFIKKIVLSGTPRSSFVAVAVIGPMDGLAYYTKLAYYKSGKKSSWKYIEETSPSTEDVTYFNGLFYAINKNGRKLAVCDLSGDSPVVTFIHALEAQRVLSFFQDRPGPDRQYLVNSMGELLLVKRFFKFSGNLGKLISKFPHKTCSFRLFKLDFAQKKWEELKSLGDMVLFIGNFSSLARKASDFPGCKLGNKIYFLDDHFDADYYKSDGDVGVYNLDDRSFDQLPCCLSNSNSQLLWPPPVWISPNPC